MSLCPLAKLAAAASSGALLAYASARLISWWRAKDCSSSDGLVFYYWPARGRGEQIRLVLVEAGVPWEQPSFNMADPSSKSAYFAECRKLGGNLTTNVPMLHVDGQYLTQSSAVLRYAARKYGLYPSCTQNKADILTAYTIDNLIAAADDLRTANYKPMVMFGGTQEQADDYVANVLPKHLSNFERLLNNGDYFTPCFSVADLTIYDALDVANRQVPGVLEKYPSLLAFHARIEARPNIAKWLASEMRAAQFAFPAL